MRFKMEFGKWKTRWSNNLHVYYAASASNITSASQEDTNAPQAYDLKYQHNSQGAASSLYDSHNLTLSLLFHFHFHCTSTSVSLWQSNFHFNLSFTSFRQSNFHFHLTFTFISGNCHHLRQLTTVATSHFHPRQLTVTPRIWNPSFRSVSTTIMISLITNFTADFKLFHIFYHILMPCSLIKWLQYPNTWADMLRFLCFCKSFNNFFCLFMNHLIQYLFVCLFVIKQDVVQVPSAADCEGSYHSSGPRLHTSMPILEVSFFWLKHTNPWG